MISMKKLFIFLLNLIALIPFNIDAVSSDSVNYEIVDMIVDAKIDASGNMTVKEVIVLDGTFNGYIRDILYENSNLNEFTGKDSDFEGSSIYNATGVDIIKVGTVSYDEKLTYDIFESEVTEFTLGTGSNGQKGVYESSEINGGKSIKMFNETNNGYTAFYIEYMLSNLIVKHNDVSELYYNFIGYNFDDDIDKLQIRVVLPMQTMEEVRVWAHGPLNGTVYLMQDEDENEDTYNFGAYLEVENLYANTPVDVRMTSPLNLFMVDHPFVKYSEVDALPKILEVEEKRADEANRDRMIAKYQVYFLYGVGGAYVLGLVLFFIYTYKKHDKEYKSDFVGEYNREFIDDYDVVHIEYLFDKKITEKAFSTSILNLIYKKAIGVTKLDGKKDDYIFTKLSDKNLNDNEVKIMDLLFNKIGNKKEVQLKNIKTYAKKTSPSGNNRFINSYNSWKNSVTKDSEDLGFFENSGKIKFGLILYSILGFIIAFFMINAGFNYIIVLVLILLALIFLIYIIVFTKRTIKGNNHYVRWKSFKKFLEDFGRFDEKELPEITLWERYLMYASIFGIADKVSKTMKIKFKEIYSSNTMTMDIFWNYYLLHSLSNDINRVVSSSITAAHREISRVTAANSTSSSGSGFGGGFSSGGGFGGGGGGGRGF